MKKYFAPIFILILGGILGTIISLFNANVNSNYYSFSNIEITISLMWDYFKIIFLNNIFVFIGAFFILRLFFYVKNIILKEKVKYSKIDKILYHIINASLLFKTGFSVGLIIMECSLQTNIPFLDLILKGIIPHGIIEMIPFIVVFNLNREMINNENWKYPFKFNKKLFIFLCFMIFIAAIIESSITPYLLYQ